MLRPESEADLAEAVAGAAGPLRVRGGGTRDYGRPVEGEVLSVAGLAGITLYDPGALTLVAQAGTPLAEIEAALAAEGQRLAFEPMDHRVLLGTAGTPTIGGVAAANVSGPRRIQAGAARDFMLGVRFVDGTGIVVKNGGRVMKNVTGYDLVKLMAGSHGTLGVLSEVAFKVLPVPETEATLVLDVASEAEAVAVMAAALGSPFEVNGAATGPLAADNSGQVFLRIEGFSASVAYRAARLADLLGRTGAARTEADPAKSRTIWQGIRDVVAFRDMAFVARLSVRPSQLSGLCRDLAEAFGSGRPTERGFTLQADWGGGLIWVAADAAALRRHAEAAPRDGADPVVQGAQALIAWLQGYGATTGGHATLIKAPAALRRAVPSFQPEAAALRAISAGLRAKFDPRGILNRGLMT